MMKMNRQIGIGLALGVAAALLWPLKEAASWKPKKFCELPQAMVRRYLPAAKLQFSPDGRYLLVRPSALKSQAQIWEVETPRRVREVPKTDARFSADSKQLWFFNARYNSLKGKRHHAVHWLSVMNMATGRSVKFFDEKQRPGDSALPDALWGLARGGREMWMARLNILRRFDARTGRLLGWHNLRRGARSSSGDLSVVLSGDRVLMTGHNERVAPIAEIGSNGQLRRRVLRSGEQTSDDLTPHALRVYATIQANLLVIRRAGDGKILWRVPAGQDFMGYSTDRRETYFSDGKGLSVRDAQTGRELRRLPGPKEYFAPSPDGKWLFETRNNAIWKWRAR